MSTTKLTIVFAVVAGLAAAFTACDDGNPAAPNSVPTPPRAAFALSGVVSEPANVPVEGASVTIVDGPHSGKSSLTDSGGGYFLGEVDGGFTIEVSKSGYVSTRKPVTLTSNLVVNVELTPAVPPTAIGGAWTVTFEPHRSCPDLTRADFRRYRADVVQQGANIDVALSGATFLSPPHLPGTIHGTDVSILLPGGCGFYCYYGPPTLPAVVETLGGNQVLAITGQVTATASGSSITGTLNGLFELWQGTAEPFVGLASCPHEAHRVTFTR